MKRTHVLAYLSALALTACAPIDSEEVADDAQVAKQEEAIRSTDAKDPLGIDAGKEPVGFTNPFELAICLARDVSL